MFATGGHELGKLANNSPRPCQLDRLDSWLDAGDFEEAVLKAVNLGDDADTTGAVCGQLAGAFWGESRIPESLRSGLARTDMIESALAGLLQRRESATSKARATDW